MGTAAAHCWASPQDCTGKRSWGFQASPEGLIHWRVNGSDGKTEVMETPGVSLRLNSHWPQQGRLVKHEGAYAVGVTVAQSPKMSRSKTERKGI